MNNPINEYPNIQMQPQPTPAAPQTPIPVAKKSFKEIVNGLKEKYKSAPKNTRLLIIAGGIFLFTIFILLVAVMVKNAGGSRATPVPVATATPIPGSPLPQVDIANPSSYATDSAILKIESDVDSLSKEMDTVDLRQSDLRVPALDFNIKFQ